MEQINRVKSISIWIFAIPFIAVNACLILITQFHGLFPNQEDIIHSTIPYLDGGASISRTARPYPSWLIFKPAMFLTSFLLIKYWIYNKEIINFFDSNHKNIKKILFFGIASAIALTIHSIFLGIKFDYDLYKFFRRFVLLAFIIFEIIAQSLLVYKFFKLKLLIKEHINNYVLVLKIILVTILIVVAIFSLPIVVTSGNTQLKHALEWNYFFGVILFYLFTYLFWKKN